MIQMIHILIRDDAITKKSSVAQKEIEFTS